MRRTFLNWFLTLIALAIAQSSVDAQSAQEGPMLIGPVKSAGQQAERPGRLDDVEKRLEEMERRHKQEMERMQQRVQELESQVKAANQQTGAKPAAPQKPLTPQEEAEQEVERMLREATGGEKPHEGTKPGDQEQVESAIDRMLREAEQQPQQRPAGGLSVLNPRITLIGDFLGRASTLPDKFPPDRGIQLEGFDSDDIDRFVMREVSLEARAAIDPFADAVMILSFGETDVKIEEAYALFHSYPESCLSRCLDAWQAKIGIFHMNFGAVNLVHTHDLPTVDRPIALQNFVTGEGLIRAGISLSKSFDLPDKTYGEWTIELASGEGLGGELEPLPFTGKDNPLALTHWKTFKEYENPCQCDPTRWWNPWIGCVGKSDLQLGATAVITARFDDESGDNLVSVVEGVDFTWKGYDPRPDSYRSYLLQSELVASQIQLTPDSTRFGIGAYLLGQVRLNRNWFAGLRGDAVQLPDTFGHQFAVTPFVSYFFSEFSRVRIQYQFLTQVADDGVRDDVGVADGHTVWVQWTWAIGAHPPEPYFVSPRF